MNKVQHLLRTLVEYVYKPKQPCASVIIPAKDCESTIAGVVKAARNSRYAAEVIVVDGHSKDRTKERALAAGARVIRQSKKLYPGKGVALRDGLKAATQEFVVFIDADIHNASSDKVDQLVEPLVLGDADFVKANYAKKRGRVTELAAKPLLRLFFRRAAAFGYPLSGEMAGKRKLLEKIHFEPDWGVDVGILLDVIVRNARAVEVDLHHKEHPQKDLDDLGAMAYQVSRAILRRARKHRRFKRLDELQTVEDIEQAVEKAAKDIQHPRKKA